MQVNRLCVVRPSRLATIRSRNLRASSARRIRSQNSAAKAHGVRLRRSRSERTTGTRSRWISFRFTSAASSRAPAAPQRLGGNGYFAARPEPVEQPSAHRTTASQATAANRMAARRWRVLMRIYQAEQDAHGYPSDQADYEQDGYEHGAHQQVDEEYYEDMPPSRRRLGVMAIAGVFALAVIGTAGAFGYRALFGSSGSPQPPPVIKADAGPSKIVPATTGKDAQSNKLITDRVNERGQSEKLVSREEQPIDKPAMAALSQIRAAGGARQRRGCGRAEESPYDCDPSGSSRVADAMPSSPLGAAARRHEQCQRLRRSSAPRRGRATARARSADAATVDAEQDQPPAHAARRRAARPAGRASRQQQCATVAEPQCGTGTRAPAPAAPTRTASLPPPAAASSANAGGPGSYVQVSSQRSEAEAQSAFRALQAKVPQPARRPSAAGPQGRPGCQGNVLPGHGRALCQRQ